MYGDAEKFQLSSHKSFGVAEWKYEFTFFDIIEKRFYPSGSRFASNAPLRLPCTEALRVNPADTLRVSVSSPVSEALPKGARGTPVPLCRGTPSGYALRARYASASCLGRETLPQHWTHRPPDWLTALRA